MELPGELRAAVESAAADIPLRELTALAGGLSQRYLEQSGTGRSLRHGEAEAVAYACARMPATYAAVRTALPLEQSTSTFIPASPSGTVEARYSA